MFQVVATAIRLCVSMAGLPDAGPHACEAAFRIAQTHGAWEPELVGAIVHHESRGDASVVGSLGDCGPMQTLWSRDRSAQDRRCRRTLRDPLGGYRAGVAKLDQAREGCRRARQYGRDCVLRVYAAGPRGLRGGGDRARREFEELEAAITRGCGGRCGPRPEARYPTWHNTSPAGS